MELNYNIENQDFNINHILKNNLHVSTRLLNKLIKNQQIFINGIVSDTRVFPNIGDKLTINFDYDEDISNIIPTKMDLDLVYEDEWLLIVNKPAGIAIHPSVLHYSDSLSNGIRYYFDSIDLHKKTRPVNRLDFNTSGLVIFAKCEYVQENLICQMSKNIFKKEYLAICEGIFEKKSGVISLPIARKDNSIIERCVSENGKISITYYEVLKEFSNYSLVKCILETGRTHQIRVHMSAISHPLIGDSLYGSNCDLFDRQALHCYKLTFVHPVSRKTLSFVHDFPTDFYNFLF